MKQICMGLLCSALLLFSTALQAQQDKTKRASPPARVTQTIASGATISIDYSQPSLKGRSVGKDVEPMKGQVWRMGANEATVFTADKDVMVEGQPLPAGKYGLWGLWGDDGYTLIFNKANNVWGTQYEENKGKDVLRVVVRPRMTEKVQEQLKYTISKTGEVSLLWGNMAIGFKVQ